nr:MBL fold metallo-hydrolase [Duganella qianjiadongensis]
MSAQRQHAGYRHSASVMLGGLTALLLLCGASKAADETAYPAAARIFRNHDTERVSQPLSSVLRWRWQRWRDQLPVPAVNPPASARPDLARLHAYAQQTGADQPSLSWIGHASVLIQAGGLSILTDPIFSERASPVQFAGPRRLQPPGIALDELPPIDVVLISHNHPDHLDQHSVLALQQQAAARGRTILFLVPLGVRAVLRDWGITQVQELDWWHSVSVSTTTFLLTPTQHWSARGLCDENRTLWGGWAVFGPTLRWYFAGDSGYSRDFLRTREHFRARLGEQGFDLALLPIGAYAPRWFMQGQHVDPAEAVQIHLDLAARRSIGIHWGTFALGDEAADQPPRDLLQARERAGLTPAQFDTIAIGATITLDPHQAPE